MLKKAPVPTGKSGGQMLILGILLMMGVLALVGSAVDVGYLVLQRQNLQNALDSAALSTLSAAYDDDASAQTLLPTLLHENSDAPTDSDALSISYPYEDADTELSVSWTVPQQYLFNRYLESDSRVFHLTSHAKISSDESEWPYFQNNAQHTADNSTSTIAPPLTKSWEFTAAGNTRSQAVIHDGIVYFTAGTNLYALDARTGAEQWHYTIGLADGCAPVITGNQIFVGTNYGYDTVYCFNSAGGKVWSTTMKNIGTSTALAVDEKYVYEQSSADGALYVYDVSTGQPIQPSLSLPVDATISRLNTGLPGAGGTGGFSAPALFNNRIYFATGDGCAIAYQRDTWATVWSYSSRPAGNLDSPLIFDNKLYYGGNSKVYCFDPATGTILWTHTTGARCSSLSGYGDKVFVGTSGKIIAMNANTGTEAWSSVGNTRQSVAAFANGYVYCIQSKTGAGLRALRISDGVEGWTGTDSLDAYFRDNGPAIGWGLVVCPGNTTKKITAYRPTQLGHPYLVHGS